MEGGGDGGVVRELHVGVKGGRRGRVEVMMMW